jgi:hypothetical protein
MIFQYGMVYGFAPNKPNVALVTNGFFKIEAIVSGDRSEVQIGRYYNIYRVNSLYYIGSRR